MHALLVSAAALSCVAAAPDAAPGGAPVQLTVGCANIKIVLVPWVAAAPGVSVATDVCQPIGVIHIFATAVLPIIGSGADSFATVGWVVATGVMGPVPGHVRRVAAIGCVINDWVCCEVPGGHCPGSWMELL